MKAQIRNHPKLKFGNGVLSSWPVAAGAWSSSANTPFPIGEQGTLREVKFLPADRSQPDRLSITIEYHGSVFSGLLRVDDTTVLPKLNTFLHSHTGEELSAIGGLEIDLP